MVMRLALLETLCSSVSATTRLSPEAKRKARGTRVDPAFAANKVTERFAVLFVFRRVTQSPRPLRDCLGIETAISGAQDHRRERLHLDAPMVVSQLKSLAAVLDGPLSPRHHRAKHSREILKDRISITSSTVFFELRFQSVQSSCNGFAGDWDDGFEWPKCLRLQVRASHHSPSR